MAKHTPDNPERRLPDADTANPHRAEPAPPPEEGLRPEADPALVRPEKEEEYGPAQGLFHAAGAEAAHEAPVASREAAAETAYLGVEEEGVESAQIFGLLLATVVAIACLILGLYFIFYLPRLSDTEAAAEDVPAARYVEQRELRAAAENLIGQYTVNPEAEGRYRIPVGAAMQQTVTAYGGRDGLPPSPFADRAAFNLAWATLGPAPAMTSAGAPATGSGEVLPDVEAAPAAAEGATPPVPTQQPAPPTGQ
jgi:hypothetical protein